MITSQKKHEIKPLWISPPSPKSWKYLYVNMAYVCEVVNIMLNMW